MALGIGYKETMYRTKIENENILKTQNMIMNHDVKASKKLTSLYSDKLLIVVIHLSFLIRIAIIWGRLYIRWLDSAITE